VGSRAGLDDLLCIYIYIYIYILPYLLTDANILPPGIFVSNQIQKFTKPIIEYLRL
jgi:hypothetical protein